MIENWVTVPGYAGIYEVSNLGGIRSLNWRNLGIVKNLTPVLDKYGYFQVCLSKDRLQKTIKLHRLIAAAFVPNANNKPCINHKDENKTNNTSDNLEWVTVKENDNHGTRNKRMAATKTNNTYNARPVAQFSLTGKFIKLWPSLSEPKRVLGYDDTHIARCCRGTKNTAYGYLWRYAEKVKREGRSGEGVSMPEVP